MDIETPVAKNQDEDTNLNIRGEFQETQRTIIYDSKTAFQAHSFRRVSLSLYDKIMEVIFIHCIDVNLKFNRDDVHSTRHSPSTVLNALMECKIPM
jgi:hypothetical protein